MFAPAPVHAYVHTYARAHGCQTDFDPADPANPAKKRICYVRTLWLCRAYIVNEAVLLASAKRTH